MVIVWDEAKRRANLLKHGFDFAAFEDGFDVAEAVRFVVAPSRTGRSRFGLIGWFRGEVVVVSIVSPLGTEALSLASMRRASATERERHGI